MIVVFAATPDVRYRTTAAPYLGTREELDGAYEDTSSSETRAVTTAVIPMQWLAATFSGVAWHEEYAEGWEYADATLRYNTFARIAYAAGDGYEVEITDPQDPDRHVVVVVSNKLLTPSPTWTVTGTEAVDERLAAIFGYTAKVSYPSQGDVPDVRPVAFWTRHAGSRETI